MDDHPSHSRGLARKMTPERGTLRQTPDRAARVRLVNSPGSLELGHSLAFESAGVSSTHEDMDEEMEAARANRLRVQALREQLREFERVTADNAKVRPALVTRNYAKNFPITHQKYAECTQAFLFPQNSCCRSVGGNPGYSAFVCVQISHESIQRIHQSMRNLRVLVVTWLCSVQTSISCPEMTLTVENNRAEYKLYLFYVNLAKAGGHTRYVISLSLHI
jgi:hypothetical protein